MEPALPLLALLAGAQALFTKRRLGPLPFELQFMLLPPALRRLANQLLARVLLDLMPRSALDGALLPGLIGRPVALDALDVSGIHQQPLTDAMGTRNAQASDHSRRQRGRIRRCASSAPRDDF